MQAITLAHIDESRCIGCTKCIKACPTDAIVGASKQMHVVLQEYCIGCQLCLPPCPANCIEWEMTSPLSSDERVILAKMAKNRIQARKARGLRQAQQKQERDRKATLKAQEIIANALSGANAGGCLSSVAFLSFEALAKKEAKEEGSL